MSERSKRQKEAERMVKSLESGLLKHMASFLYPILKILFPEIPKNHESFSLIASNMVMNILGLGNAATPFGLKAMSSLQEINPNKEVASRSMITFLVMNTASITLSFLVVIIISSSIKISFLLKI